MPKVSNLHIMPKLFPFKSFRTAFLHSQQTYNALIALWPERACIKTLWQC